MNNWIKLNTKECDICREIYSYDSRQKNSKYCSQRCRSVSSKQKKINGVENIDFVICKICGLKFKEINNDHMKIHNITCDDYDKIYKSQRTSEKTRHNKNTLSSMMNEELSKKLSNSHTIENYKSKYGEEEGVLRFNLMLDRKRYKNSRQSYKDKYSDDWEKIYSEVQNKKKITLDNLIIKYGQEEGNRRFEEFKHKRKVKNLLSTYINKHGYEMGLEKWLDKNNKISISNSKIEIEDRDNFKYYISEVNKYTRVSLEMNNLDKLELRGKENGYDLDHIVSKVNGFKNKIPAYIIGHISNLRIIESSYNRKKQHKSELPIEFIINRSESDDLYKKLLLDIINLKNGNN